MARFKKTDYGFWKQVDQQPFVYDQAYKDRQSTNDAMVHLRIGWLAAHLGYEKMKAMWAVDVGCGNGIFVKLGARYFKRLVGYDVAGESITKEELLTTSWDLAVFSDVAEHLPDLGCLFKIPWKMAFVSYPETPYADSFEELKGWRHFKPDEHLWCLNEIGMGMLAGNNGCCVVAQSNVEDLIRTRWNNSQPNITSLLIRRIDNGLRTV